MGVNEFIKIGSKIKQLRTEKGYTQTQFAEMLKIPRTTYVNYENGKREPKSEIITKIAEALNINVPDLIPGATPIFRDEITRYNSETGDILHDMGYQDFVGKVSDEELYKAIKVLIKYSNTDPNLYICPTGKELGSIISHVSNVIKYDIYTFAQKRGGIIKPHDKPANVNDGNIEVIFGDNVETTNLGKPLKEGE